MTVYSNKRRRRWRPRVEETASYSCLLLTYSIFTELTASHRTLD